jgi:hypothetical protein
MDQVSRTAVATRDVSNVWRAGIIPTLAALVTAAILHIERAQVDWAVDCAGSGLCNPKFSFVTPSDMSAWMLPIFVFAILHASFVRYPVDIEVSRLNRFTRIAIFIAVSLFPFFLWYLFYAGVAFGFIAAITIVLMPFMIPVGVMGGGLVAGLALAVTAGPAFSATPWATWRALFWLYGKATFIATLVLTGGHVLFDPQFNGLQITETWLSAIGMLTSTALACIIIWRMVFRRDASEPSGLATSETYRGLATTTAASLGLAVASHLMVTNGATVFARDGSFAEPIVAFMRANKPAGSTKLTFGGLDFVGNRSIITERGALQRDRDQCETVNKGTDKEYNACRTVYDPYPEWQIKAPDGGDERLYIIADGGGEPARMFCEKLANGIERCLYDVRPMNDPKYTEVERRVAYKSEDGFEFAPGLTDASRAVSFLAKSRGEDVPSSQWKYLYCRLNLINIGPAKLSAHQVVDCEADWPDKAKQIRTYVEGLFATVNEPAQK